MCRCLLRCVQRIPLRYARVQTINLHRLPTRFSSAATNTVTKPSVSVHGNESGISTDDKNTTDRLNNSTNDNTTTDSSINNFIEQHNKSTDSNDSTETTTSQSNTNTKSTVTPTIPPGCLTSEFIDISLYHTDSGYFNNQQRIINPIHNIDWSTVKSHNQYIQLLNKLYTSSETAWLTPVELYQPYYGITIANYLIEHYITQLKRFNIEVKSIDTLSTKQHKTFNIIEIGGGTGTLAVNILDYIEKHYPALYEHIQYTIIDFSVKLHTLQQSALAHHINNHKVTLQNKSAIHITAPNNVHNAITCIVGIEVLDNMSHDKIIQRNNQLLQTHVYEVGTEPTYAHLNNLSDIQKQSNSTYYEVYEPVHDSTIVRWLQLTNEYNDAIQRTKQHYIQPATYLQRAALYMSLFSDKITKSTLSRNRIDANTTYIPTTALKFLTAVKQQIPHANILLADFSYLPNTIHGINGPIVSQKSQGHVVDANTYLVDLGSADIFFPSNLVQLLYVYNKLHSNKHSTGTVYSTYEFMKRYARDEYNIVIKGKYELNIFRPMNDDYINFQYLCI